jgi:L-threonylcarbamoyladenylate synthase
MLPFNNDIEACLEKLHAGGLILYPTDTVWGIGCDATNHDAVDKDLPPQKAFRFQSHDRIGG